MAQVSYDKMKVNRAKMFERLDIDPTFEPFIGCTYNCEGQKRILFVSYDEWAYMEGASKYDPKPDLPKKPISNQDNRRMDVKELFRASPYYRHINKVLKAIKSGLTTEDTAFYNFVVRPIDWKNTRHKRNDREAYYIKDSVKAFKAVISFCDPDIVVFCDYEDYRCINIAMDAKLNDFLRERGIEWLDSGNLNFDSNLDYDRFDTNPNYDPSKQNNVPIFKTIGGIRHYELRTDPTQIQTHIEYRIADEEYDRINLNLYHDLTDNEPRYHILGTAPLQTLAYFLDCELKSTGRFKQLRLYEIIKKLERELQSDYEELMFEHVEPILEGENPEEYFSNPLSSFVKPNLYYTLHMLKAIGEAYKETLSQPTIPRRKFSCTYLSQQKLTKLRENDRKKQILKKKEIAEKNEIAEKKEQAEKMGVTDKKPFTRIKWNLIRTQNQEEYKASVLFKQLQKKEHKIVQRIHAKVGYKELTPEEEEYIRSRTTPQLDYDALYEAAAKQQQKIFNMIRNNRSISLEALSKETPIDEYYLGQMLKAWGFKKANGQWTRSDLNRDKDYGQPHSTSKKRRIRSPNHTR